MKTEKNIFAFINFDNIDNFDSVAVITSDKAAVLTLASRCNSPISPRGAAEGYETQRHTKFILV